MHLTIFIFLQTKFNKVTLNSIFNISGCQNESLFPFNEKSIKRHLDCMFSSLEDTKNSILILKIKTNQLLFHRKILTDND